MASNIETNFDVSIVMPFFRKADIFEQTILRNAVYFQRNGIEVVISMDESSEEDRVLSIVRRFALINWKIIINREPHEWRNPAAAINVGIRHATKTYIMVMGPDSEMNTDIIAQMRRIIDYYPNCFCVGKVVFVSCDFNAKKQNVSTANALYYGSLFVKAADLHSVDGYDESLIGWGGDDDNVRARLQRLGLRKMKLPSCILLHREAEEDLQNSRVAKHTHSNLPLLRRAHYPNSTCAQLSSTWGTAFDEIIYDWSNNRYGLTNCLSYLQTGPFSAFDINTAAFEHCHDVIALIPTYNESVHIVDLVQHLSKHVDGIVLLDDGSSDATYDLCTGEKVVVKAKKVRTEFNELENRNILLDIASTINSRYLLFMDADERFDERYCNVRQLAQQDIYPTICFYLVHLWGSKDEYRTDVPESSPIGQAGILHRWRMFRNIGRAQITGNKMHVQATPYKQGKFIAPVLVIHHGMLTQEIRLAKRALYLKEDERLHENPAKYDYFLAEQVNTKAVEEIVLPA